MWICYFKLCVCEYQAWLQEVFIFWFGLSIYRCGVILFVVWIKDSLIQCRLRYRYPLMDPRGFSVPLHCFCVNKCYCEPNETRHIRQIKLTEKRATDGWHAKTIASIIAIRKWNQWKCANFLFQLNVTGPCYLHSHICFQCVKQYTLQSCSTGRLCWWNTKMFVL